MHYAEKVHHTKQIKKHHDLPQQRAGCQLVSTTILDNVARTRFIECPDNQGDLLSEWYYVGG
jgi:hypothetical protein